MTVTMMIAGALHLTRRCVVVECQHRIAVRAQDPRRRRCSLHADARDVFAALPRVSQLSWLVVMPVTRPVLWRSC